LHNFAAYAAVLAGLTAAVIASGQLGAVGGPNGDAFMLALTRATEICIGIVSAGIVLAGTDFGSARRRLATEIAAIAAEIAARFVATLAAAGPGLPDTRPVRRELLGRVIALAPVIDEALGESSQLRYRSPVLQTAVDGLFAALAGWRAIAGRLASHPDDRTRNDASDALQVVPGELRSTPECGEPSRWVAEPVALYRACAVAAQRLIELPADTPSRRLIADQTAAVLVGLSQALNGIALLVDPTRPVSRRRTKRVRVPDWLPAFVNAGRAFVTICAVALFWIATAWPSGALAITFAAIGVTMFAPRADQAYAMVLSFMAGTILAAFLAAVVEFAVLPQVATFAGFALSIGLVLVPAGAGMAQPWKSALFVAITANFIPLLAPANQMHYDAVQFYNTTLAIVAGVGSAAVSFRLLPPLSAAYRTRRLLGLSLRDLRSLATATALPSPDDWESRTYGRLVALPAETEPLRRAQLLAVLTVGSEIIRLRRMPAHPDSGDLLGRALAALARGDVVVAQTGLARLDEQLAAFVDAASLRARAGILAISETIAQHAPYFADGAHR